MKKIAIGVLVLIALMGHADAGPGIGIAIDANSLTGNGSSTTPLGLRKTCAAGYTLVYDGANWGCALAGDITSVGATSGGGLTGGATSGAALLGLITTCGTNQELRWNGTAWACADTVTAQACSAGQHIVSVTAAGVFTCSADSGSAPSGTGIVRVTSGVYDARAELSGDVTTSGSLATTIGNNKVTYAKMQDVSATSRVLGRITAGAGDPEELTGAQVTTLLTLFDTSSKGVVPLSPGGTTAFLRADGAWATPSGGAPSGTGLVRVTGGAYDARAELSGDVTTAGALATTIASNAVTYAKMQDVSATSRFIGRITAGAGDPEELTGTQATSLLDTFSTAGSTKGLVAGSSGATTSCLKGNNTWGSCGGITNSAGAGVLMKSDGTNAVASIISESGTIDSVAGSVEASGHLTASAYVEAHTGGYFGASFGVNAIQSGLYFDYTTAGPSTGIINQVGASESTSQYRSLAIADGKCGTGGMGSCPSHIIATFDGTTLGTALFGSLTVVGTVGTSAPIQIGTASSLGTRTSGGVTATSCGGAGLATVGDRTAGHVTTGAAATGCVLTWGSAFSSATPTCTVSSRASASKAFGYAPVAASLTLSSATAGVTYDWVCFDHN